MGSETVIYVLYIAGEGGIKGEKYILLLGSYFMTIKGEAAKTQLFPHNKRKMGGVGGHVEPKSNNFLVLLFFGITDFFFFNDYA